jgi:DNA-directed RNA polymerase subunit RPC12/RpoP
MAKKRKFTVGKTPIDLDKIAEVKPNVTRRIRCSDCGYRLRITGQEGSMTLVRCPNCDHSHGYEVPLADTI